MRTLHAPVLLLLTLIPSAAAAAAFCPTDATTGCGAFCPSQAECDAGWQWATPSRAMVLLPQSLVRGADGKLLVNLCTLDAVAYPPWSNPRDGQSISACGPSYPPSVSLRTWCDVVKSLPAPPECSRLPCTRPDFTGVCGQPLFGEVPAFVEETIAAAATWVSNPRQQARLQRVAAWLARVNPHP